MRTLLAVGAAVLAAGAAAGADTNLAGRVTCSGAWALYPMAVRWGEEFGKLHPGVRFDISAGGAGKGMTDALAGAVDIGMVSRDVSAEEVARGALALPVTKDAVVPMVNAGNPALADLRRRGAGRDALQGVWVRGDVKTWGRIAGTDLRAPVRVYTRSDACGAGETWARYLGAAAQNALKGTGVYGDPGLAEAVRRDVLGIGYNNVNFAYDANTDRVVSGLAVLPLDVNGNGALDPEEDFYGTRSNLVAAIAAGRYPSPPARLLFFVTKGKPTRPAVLAFVRWVLGEGQRFAPESGYLRLPEGSLQATRKMLE